jgi:hypothetical protein
MTEQKLTEILTSVQFVVAPSGKRLAVLDADDWAGLIEWLEDIEDQRILEAAKERLKAGPEASGAIPLEDALDEL